MGSLREASISRKKQGTGESQKSSVSELVEGAAPTPTTLVSLGQVLCVCVSAHLCVRAPLCVYVYACVYMCVLCVCISVCMYVSVYMPVCLCVCLYANVCVLLCKCLCVCACALLCVPTCEHMHLWRTVVLWEPQPLLLILGIIRPVEEADFASCWLMAEVDALYGLAELVEEG